MWRKPSETRRLNIHNVIMLELAEYCAQATYDPSPRLVMLRLLSLIINQLKSDH